MKNNTKFLLSSVFLIGCIWVGGFFGMYLVSKESDAYNFYDLVIPMTVGVFLGPIIYFILSKWGKKRSKNIPNVDERTVMLMKRYLLIVLYVVLFGSGAALIVLYSVGIQSIETVWLIVYLAALYIVIGVGAFVTKRL